MRAVATASAASSVQPPRKIASLANSSCSSGVSSSWDHAIVARSVFWRASASRPPSNRSSRCERRSRICRGESTFVRAAASSIASGRSSRRLQSASTGSSAGSPEREQKRSTASACARGGTAYSTSPRTRSSSRLVVSSLRFAHDSTSVASSGAASITCSRLSSSNRSSRSPMCSSSPCLAPSACAIVGSTRSGSRSPASSTQKTPALKSGTSSAGHLDREPRLARAARTGQRDQARPVLEQRGQLLDLAFASDERAGRARQVRVGDRLQRREGLRPELEEPNRLVEVLEPVLAQIEHLRVHAVAGRRGEEHLPAVGCGRHPGAEMHVQAHVALLGHGRLTRRECPSERG